MNTNEIDAAITQKTKDIIVAQEALNVVERELYETKRKLVELSEAKRQARFNISRMRAENELLTREFWRSRNG